MEVDGLAADVEREHGVQAGEQQCVGDLHAAAGDVDGDAAVAEDGFRLADDLDQLLELAELRAEFVIEHIGLVALRAQHLDIAFGAVLQAELHDAVAAFFGTNEIDLCLAVFASFIFRHFGFLTVDSCGGYKTLFL